MFALMFASQGSVVKIHGDDGQRVSLEELSRRRRPPVSGLPRPSVRGPVEAVVEADHRPQPEGYRDGAGELQSRHEGRRQGPAEATDETQGSLPRPHSSPLVSCAAVAEIAPPTHCGVTPQPWISFHESAR